MKACRGKYIAFCEGDDFWHHPEKLQRQVDYMESHPECGMVFADCDVYHNDSGELQRNVRYTDGYQFPFKLSIEQILGNEKIRRWPWTCTTMIRMDLYEHLIEADPYLHQSEAFLIGDIQLFAELALLSDVIYIPECVATYRVHDKSVTNTTDDRKRLQFWISLSEMEMYLCDKHKLSNDIRKKAEAVWEDKCLCLAFHDRNAELAQKVREKKRNLTWKEWISYVGAKYMIINYGCRIAIILRNLIKNRKYYV